MKNKKKIFSISLIIALIAVIAGGTLAYFTDETETTKNTFTVGNIEVELTESKTTNGGRELVKKDKKINESFTGNDYHLVPGVEYIKDPKIWVSKGSEPSYVFVRVENQLNDDFVKTQIEEQMTDNGWRKVESTILPSGDLAENIWIQENVVDASSQKKELTVFSGFTIDSNADQNSLKKNENKNIIVNAFAIQSEGLEEIKAIGLAVEHFYKTTH